MPPRGRRQHHKLEQSPFYKLGTRRKLSEILMCSARDLKEVATLTVRYKNRWKPKDSDTKPWLTHPPSPEDADNYRPIDIPVPKLKRLQARVADLLSRIETPDYLFSPVKGVSYVDNAARHRDSRAFWLLDIAQYFPSCTANRVAWFFGQKLECAPDIAAILTSLTTEQERLPQGSPCSPIIAYFSNLIMWNDISDAVQHSGCILSVYADDITISGVSVPGTLIWDVKQIIHKNGFSLKAAKELSLIHAPADITGVIVRNGQLKLPNRQYKKMKELILQRRRSKGDKAIKKLGNRIRGCLSQRNQIEDRN